MKQAAMLEKPTWQEMDGNIWPKTSTELWPSVYYQQPYELGCAFFPSWDFRWLLPNDILIVACERPWNRRCCKASPGYLTHRNYDTTYMLSFLIICYAAIYNKYTSQVYMGHLLRNILGLKTSLIISKRKGVILSMFTERNGSKLKVFNRKTYNKCSSIWKLSNT